MTSNNANGNTGPGITGTVTYDVTTKTLTLNNANITGYYTDGFTYSAGIYLGDSDIYSIVLVGANTIDNSAITVNEVVELWLESVAFQ